MNRREVAMRFLVAGLGIPAIMGCILFGKLLTVFAVAVIESVALFEFYQLYWKKGYAPNRIAGLGMAVLITVCIYFYQMKYLAPVLFFAILLVMIWEMFRNDKHPVINIALTLFGMIYLSLFSSLILIREFPKGSEFSYLTGGWLVMQIFFTIWLCDTAAYFWGSKFGKHPLFKKVSPKKTWEGAIAGFLIAIPGALFVRLMFIPKTSLIHSVVLGLIVGTLGQMGDLMESFIKRDAGVKDSSELLLSHGGFLDRFDSPIIVAPLVYLSMQIFGI